MNRFELKLKQLNKFDITNDYIEWAVNMIEEGNDGDLLYELAGSRKTDNIFDIIKLYNNVCMSLSYCEPTYNDCQIFKAISISRQILARTGDLFELSKKIYRVCQEADYKILMEWYWINEDIDALKYDTSSHDLSRENIEKKIMTLANVTSQIQTSSLYSEK